MSAPMILAESEVERIIRLSRNAEFARAYLEKGIRVPTFPEILAEYSGVTDASALREKLCTRLQGMIGEPNAASIRRKVSVWFTGKTAPENRGQLVRIVFALDMSDEQAQNFLACAGGGCLHQRNPIELAYLYALQPPQLQRGVPPYRAYPPYCHRRTGQNRGAGERVHQNPRGR